ncbi:putative Cdc37 [Trachipleistophora hominis]|uniref:Putative Cdc37 n=1 Tax=Trachipleistophora hominis TaxID=72359 RepID=L7JX59_TRAHO|nr:putative Cdc37 [Trachipleistophora hominis]
MSLTLVMNHPINEMELSSDSTEYEHPNIEKSTLRRLVREKRKHDKEEWAKELDNIKKILSERYDPELENRKKFLEQKLKPKFVETSTNMINNTVEERNEDDKFADYLLFLGGDPTIDNFIEFVEDTKNINLERFDEFLLMNLSENIKEGLDEAGMVISTLSLYFKYLKQGGMPLLRKLSDSLKDESKKHIFDEECRKYYEDSKDALLNLKNTRKQTEG